jgi:hypothetical protein
MGIQISKPALLVHGILLHIQPRGINMSPKNIHALFHRFFPDLEHDNGFVHADRINLISLFQRLVLLHQSLEFLIAFLDLIDNQVDAFPFRFAVIQKIHIFFCMLLQFLKLVFVIGFPYIFLFHLLFPF